MRQETGDGETEDGRQEMGRRETAQTGDRRKETYENIQATGERRQEKGDIRKQTGGG